MNRKIESLKKAYQSGNRARLIKAARSLVAYERDRGVEIGCLTHAGQVIRLARKIVELSA